MQAMQGVLAPGPLDDAAAPPREAGGAPERTREAPAVPAPGRPPAVPEPAIRPSGIRGLQEKVKQAARSYLSHGNAAVSTEWSEFGSC